MNKKIIFTLLLIFAVCLSAGTVFADDVNMEMDTASAMDDSSNILSPIDNGDGSVADEDIITLQESSLIGDGDSEEEISSFDEDVLTDGEGTSFKDLSIKINSATGVLNLTEDYTFNIETDGNFINGIPINKKDLIINGNNHYIDAKGQSSIFKLFDTGLTINNLTFMNSKGSAIFSNYSDISTNNVIFSDCVAENGAAICGHATSFMSSGDKFINNYAKKGAAIFLDDDSELELVNGSFVSDKELYYGVIYLSYSKMAILNTTFVNLTSTYSPAIFGTNVKGDIKNCRFVNLYANITAGAIALKNIEENIVIENCTFMNVSSKRNGGAIFNEMVTDLKFWTHIRNCEFIDCSSEFGGAILHLGTRLDVRNSNFTNNVAKYRGGAIYISNAFDFTVINSRFFDNTLENISEDLNHGSAIFADRIVEGFKITNSNFTNNLADYAGAIYLYDSSYDFSNSYFSGNGENIYSTFDGETAKTKNNTFVDGTNKLHQKDYGYVFEGNPIDIEYDPIIFDESYINSSYFNLADFGIVVPIKNQLGTDTCWAFGTSTALELALLKATNGNLKANFSKNAISFYGNEYSIYGDIFNTDGGDSYMAASYFLAWLGGFLDEDVSDFDEVGRIAIQPKDGDKFHLQNFVAIPQMEFSKDMNVYKEALIKYGALTFTVNAPNSLYKDDYNPDTAGAYFYEPVDDFEGPQSNHIVVLVGWDDNYSKNNFIKTPPGDGAWIIQNSWGEEWGDHGYYYVSYYDTAFATINSPIAFVLDEGYQYNKVYQYDVILCEFNYENSEDVKAYANVYNATGDDLISAVGTYFAESGANYKIIIKVNGNTAYSQSGKSSHRGYETIKLDKSIAVKKGDTFRVEIQTKFAPVHDESRYIIPDGVSFVDYGDGFEDISVDNEFASIKVYAVPNTIITNNSVKYYTDESPFTVTVEPNEDVTFEINGIKATIRSDENGTAGIGLNLKPGNYTIEVGYNGTKIVFPITIKSTIVSQDVSRGRNSNYTYKVQLLNSTGGAIKNTKISVTVNGKSKTYTTDNNGYISIPFTKLTSNQVITVLNPITKEQSKNTIKVVSRFSGNKNIKMYYNNGTKYTVKVYGDNAKLVGANQVVLIKLNKKTYKVKTNSKGVASLKIPKSLKPGTYTITATYKGQTIKNTVKVLSRIAGNKNVNMYYFDGSKYSVKVYGKTGKLLSKQTVTIKLNKKTYKVKSNKKGVASLKIPKTVKPGTYTISASYAGLTVKNKVKVKQVLSSQKTKTVKRWWKKFTLKATLKNGKKPLKGKKISFKFKGKTYKAKTNSKGVAKVTIKRKVIRKLKRGKSYKVSITYLKDTIKRTVKVKR
ncbi:C1 family peptidase [Methanobrevibacter sp.]|uniref:C1 family peptidase n=1 Tax=Methanobrevibacter sp. TaxID=66852 RepID=UPI00389014CC